MDLKAGGSLNTGTDNFDNHPTNYFVPNFGVDQDILDTQKHLKDALKLAGKKSWKEAETCSKTKKATNKINF